MEESQTSDTARRLLTLSWPVLVPLLGAFVALQALSPGGAASATARSAATFLPPILIAAAGLLAWRFNRSRVVYVALTVGLSAEALSLFLPGGTQVQMATARAGLSMIVSLNLVVFALIQERGLTTTLGLTRFSLFGFEAVGLWSLTDPQNALMGRLLDTPLFALPWFLHPSLARPAVLVFLAAFLILLWRALTTRGAIEVGILGALLAAGLVLQPEASNTERQVYLAAAGLVLVLALVETSHSLAYRDELTSLPGRRALNEQLGQLSGRYALAMLDIDHFKKFNDSYGHDAGDQCLRFVSAKLAAVPGGGRAYRYGGEEFTVLFPGKTVSEAAPFLEQLRESIADSKFTVRAQGRPKKKPDKPTKAGPMKSVGVTMSMGAAEFGDASGAFDDPQLVMQAADKRLYKSKREGRNRLTFKG
ncbi:MAG: GGDEF domain-containing protein [Myxococcales bacterium]|nr:GGDEF domain-containing protein [Myxococcales bacterium]